MPTPPQDPALAIEHVRALIADPTGTDELLSDAQVTVYLQLNGWNVRRGAADALDAIASSEVLVSKKIRTQDLDTDGPAVAEALRKHADRLRAQAEAEDESEGWFGFDVIYPSNTNRPEATEHQVWGL